MNPDQKLLVCESVLARLDAAMTSAEAEAIRASALEDHLRRLLDNLAAGQARLDCALKAAVRPPRDGVGQQHRPPGATDDLRFDLREPVGHVNAVEGKLLLLGHSEEA